MKRKMRTRSQEMALYVLKKVKNHIDKKYAEKYESYASKLPALIVNNGLIQTLAFYKLKSGSEKAYFHLYNDFNEYFKTQLKLKENSEELIDYLIHQETDSNTYRFLTREALHLAEWFKRLSNIHLKGKQNEQE